MRGEGKDVPAFQHYGEKRAKTLNMALWKHNSKFQRHLVVRYMRSEREWM